MEREKELKRAVAMFERLESEGHQITNEGAQVNAGVRDARVHSVDGGAAIALSDFLKSRSFWCPCVLDSEITGGQRVYPLAFLIRLTELFLNIVDAKVVENPTFSEAKEMLWVAGAMEMVFAKRRREGVPFAFWASIEAREFFAQKQQAGAKAAKLLATTFLEETNKAFGVEDSRNTWMNPKGFKQPTFVSSYNPHESLGLTHRRKQRLTYENLEVLYEDDCLGQILAALEEDGIEVKNETRWVTIPLNLALRFQDAGWIPLGSYVIGNMVGPDRIEELRVLTQAHSKITGPVVNKVGMKNSDDALTRAIATMEKLA